MTWSPADLGLTPGGIMFVFVPRNTFGVKLSFRIPTCDCGIGWQVRWIDHPAALTRQPRPESGLDCLMCAMFYRQRSINGMLQIRRRAHPAADPGPARVSEEDS